MKTIIISFVVVAITALLLGVSLGRDSQQSSPVEAVQVVATPQPIDLQIQPIQVEVTVKQSDVQAQVENTPQIIYVQAQPQPIQVAPTATQTPFIQPTLTPVINKPLFKVLTPSIAPVSIASPVSAPVLSQQSSQAQASTLTTPINSSANSIKISPPTATPDPCSNRLCNQITIDYTGMAQRPVTQLKCNVLIGASAWDCLKQAANGFVQFKDFGGSLGIEILGLYGVEPVYAQCSCFWEFDINGKASDVGVSTYKLKQGDIIDFKIAK